MEYGHSDPVYAMGIAAKSIKVCQATLRLWEKKGLIKPARLGKNRYYSKSDLERMEHIKYLLQDKRINIEGVRSILQVPNCWEIKLCKPARRNSCPVYLKNGIGRGRG